MMNQFRTEPDADALAEVIGAEPAEAPPPAPLTIFNAVVQKVDCKGQVLGEPFYRTNEADIKAYLTGVIRSVVSISRSQRFQFCDKGFDSKEDVAQLTSADFKTSALAWTERLLDCEIAAQKKIVALKKELRTGSLLCAHFKLAETEHVMLVKIDHAGFLDEVNFQHTSGLPEKQRAQKCATFSVIGGSIDNTVIISDSNNTLTEYWWSSFLNLKPLSDPELNTFKAFKAIEGFLKTKIEKTSPSDYWTLRNAFVSYFTTRPNCLFDQMIDEIMGGYPCADESLNMPKLAQEAKLLPKKNDFDSHFAIAPHIISNKIKRQIRLAENLDLRINGEIANYEKMFSTGDDDGRKYLKIYSNEGYDAFKKRDS
ncbi:hypothetical protein APB64_29925 [Pseudomonas aeruginosa]|uniref:nucleoid-associated protein n=3 Tax=Pseudomonas aeruginosa TaxID=287 RepID=UPI0009A322D9|nr:nucleoid-associated protein [Pseudomonas aeruginosa]MBA4912668.1 nucleoid-associated protein [Pseudomonas aeruginosa]MBH9023611.1 nucleoid-associated protein [Pseudomonas aeruginosa]MCO1837373.1 nucleoid-associated protein [Pseudomonas aeruginosa]MCO2647021.1 nucleoid-associated protein [Pseudomonas aeruginosa]MCO3925759.1 nucleoid-associated protein [Pseudomonas aeruginosa]